jgi:L-arabinose isomerase
MDGYEEVRNRLMEEKKKNEIRPKIGLLPTGHFYYWSQFPRLKEMGMRMYKKLLACLTERVEVAAPELIDTVEKARRAVSYFKDKDIDMVLVFPFGYTPSMLIVPIAHELDVPIRILNAHEDSSYDYTAADTTMYLHHEGVCCIPEYAGALVNLGRSFKVRTGFFDQPRLWEELEADFRGAAAARFFKQMNIGLIGEVYTSTGFSGQQEEC